MVSSNQAAPSGGSSVPFFNVFKKPFFKRKKGCALKNVVVDYRDIQLLSRFISERGRILPRRITGVSAKKQRELKLAIKRARLLALLPFSNI